VGTAAGKKKIKVLYLPVFHAICILLKFKDVYPLIARWKPAMVKALSC
jgi:hypothetical protein